MSDAAVEVVGLSAANDSIRRFAVEVPGFVAVGTREYVGVIASAVQDRVPVLTGALRDSVLSQPEDAGNDIVMGSDEVPYAGWIEYGGSRGRDLVEQGRYLYPTAWDRTDELAQIASDAITRAISEFPWPTPT